MGSVPLQIRQLSVFCCCGRFSAAVEMESLLGQQRPHVRMRLYKPCMMNSNVIT